MNAIAYHCRDCCHAFADFYAYDAHQAYVGDYGQPDFGLRCRTDAELIDYGMRLVAGVWTFAPAGAEIANAGRVWDSEYEGKP